jgi:hypothetical protein
MGVWGRMTLTITPGSLVVHPMVYNKSTSGASIDSSSVTFSGSFDSDTFSAVSFGVLKNIFPGLSVSYTATFDDMNVSDSVPGTITTTMTYKSNEMAAPGFIAVNNYSFTAAILPAPVTISTSNMSIQTKEYDGTTNVTIEGAPDILSGVYSGDLVSAFILNAEFENATAGTKNVLISFALTNPNYKPATTSVTLTGAINKALLTVTGVTALPKVADDTTDLTITGTPSLYPIYGSDAPVASVSASFPSASVGCYPITGTITLTGNGASNYSVPSIDLGIVCITTPPVHRLLSLPLIAEKSHTPIAVRNSEHGNSTVINDRLANAYAASRQIPQPIARPMDATTRTKLLRGASAVQR